MTNPVILLGTQSNGETLPVQVDATGRLVAEGLPGPEGPPGPEGGSFPLPPNPYEGAILGWLNGGLEWLGSPPVPIPENVFGPITAWDGDNTLLAVDGQIPAEVGNGVYVYQCNQDGSEYMAGHNVSEEWSLNAVSDPNSPELSPSFVFDGDLETGYTGFQNTTCTMTLRPIPINGKSVQVYGWDRQGGGNAVVINDVIIQGMPAYASANWKDITSQLSSAGVTHISEIKNICTSTAPKVAAIRIDGEVLTDRSASLSGRVNQVIGNSLLIVPNNDTPWTPGKYLKTNEQRVAPWLLYGNDTTSLIDHLRSSRD